jgi:hypothetical protein
VNLCKKHIFSLPSGWPIKMMRARRMSPCAAFAPITEARMHPQSHTLDKPTPAPAPQTAWVALRHRGLEGLSSASPWLMALGLYGAYVTTDKPQWVALNLVFCIGMVVVALLRLWHVLSEPLAGTREH